MMRVYVFYSPTDLFHQIKIVDDTDTVVKEMIVAVDDIPAALSNIQKEYNVEEIVGW